MENNLGMFPIRSEYSTKKMIISVCSPKMALDWILTIPTPDFKNEIYLTFSEKKFSYDMFIEDAHEKVVDSLGGGWHYALSFLLRNCPKIGGDQDVLFNFLVPVYFRWTNDLVENSENSLLLNMFIERLSDLCEMMRKDPAKLPGLRQMESQMTKHLVVSMCMRDYRQKHNLPQSINNQKPDLSQLSSFLAQMQQQEKEYKEEKKNRRCEVCKGENNLKRCTGCLCVFYCSPEHQKADWKKHKKK